MIMDESYILLSEEMGFRMEVLGVIAGGLTDDEINKICKIYLPESHMTRKVMLRTKTGEDLLNLLLSQELVTRKNLLYLQAMLWWLPRRDLINEILLPNCSKGKCNGIIPLHFIFDKNKGLFTLLGSLLCDSPQKEVEKYRIIASNLLRADRSAIAITAADQLKEDLMGKPVEAFSRLCITNDTNASIWKITALLR